MKKIFIPMFAVAALMASSCADDESMMVGNEQVAVLEDIDVDFDADFTSLSKTSLDASHNYQFDGGEEVVIFNALNENRTTLTNKAEAGTSVKLQGANPAVTGCKEYYAVMPSSAALGRPAKGVVRVAIPATQVVNADNFDASAHLFLAKTSSVSKFSFFTANSFLRIKNTSKLTLTNIVVDFNGVNVVGNYDYTVSKKSFVEAGDNASIITLNGTLNPGESCLVSIMPTANIDQIGFTAKDENNANVTGGYKSVDHNGVKLDFERNSFVSVDPGWWHGATGDGNDDGNDDQSLSSTLNISALKDFISDLEVEPTSFIFGDADVDLGDYDQEESIELEEDSKYAVINVYRKESVYYILSEKTIVLPENCAQLFSGYKSLTSITFNNVDASKVTNASQMFAMCDNLNGLVLPAFSALTNMSSMFQDCVKLTSIILPNTANVTDMSDLFNGCENLADVQFGQDFSTEKVENMNNMFKGCTKLATINVANFNTSAVTNMAGMFDGCAAVKSLDLTSFSFANVTAMSKMFNGCAELMSITVKSDLDIVYANVSDNGSDMFTGCVKLKGGKDTAYDEYHTGVEYARVDEPNSIVENIKPGYFSVVYVPDEPQNLSKKAVSHQGFTW
ncbi:MAG: BspA family leucine-rich repeat surface protein [Bacteroidales bacterium]|nr:BspA family leucine-rich repeat surface protein [Bacteroidales bacterium]